MNPKLSDATSIDHGWHEAVLKGIHAAMITTDRAGRITHMNDRALTLVGMELEDMQGLEVLTAIGIHASFIGQPLPIPLNEVLENGKRIDLPCGASIRTIYGNLSGWLNIGPLRDDTGAIFGAVVLLGVNQPQQLGFDEPGLAQQSGSVAHDALFARKDGIYVRIDIEAIQVVEAMENYVLIATEKERFVVHSTMKQMLEKLARHGFVRIHRSYIVPTGRILSIEDSRVKIADKYFPIGKSYRMELLNALSLL